MDSLGNTVTYEPQFTLDAVGATAWRCPGSAIGQQLVHDLGAPVTVASVALVRGHAKVDPADGTDRFLENRTVTVVAWQFDDGSTERQSIASPSVGMAELELPEAVTTRRLVLEIAGTGKQRRRHPGLHRDQRRPVRRLLTGRDHPVRNPRTASARASASTARPLGSVRIAASPALRRFPASSITAGTSARLRVPRSVRGFSPSQPV